MNENAEYLDARRHVRARRGLRTHAAVFVLVNLLLLVVDTVTPGGWWFYWPLLGWSIGLAVHSTAVYGGKWRSGDSEEEEVRRYMEHHHVR